MKIKSETDRRKPIKPEIENSYFQPSNIFQNVFQGQENAFPILKYSLHLG